LIDVQISHVPDTTSLDGKHINSKRRSGFFLFAMPGEHEIRATLAGYRDGRASFTACKGGSMDVAITLEPLPADPPIEPIPKPLPEPAAISAPRLDALRLAPIGDPRNGIAEAVVVIDGKPLPRQEDPYGYEDPAPAEGKKSRVKGSIGAGPVMVLGVASWLPAFGPSIAAELQFGPLSFGADVRAAWSAFDVGGKPISAMTAGALLSACGNWRWLFACGTGHVGIIRADASTDSFTNSSFTGFRPGFGARAGLNLPVHGAFGLRVSTDVLALTRRTRIAVGPVLISDQAPILIGANLLAFLRF
jgi:hypothetical protein